MMKNFFAYFSDFDGPYFGLVLIIILSYFSDPWQFLSAGRRNGILQVQTNILRRSSFFLEVPKKFSPLRNFFGSVVKTGFYESRGIFW